MEHVFRKVDWQDIRGKLSLSEEELSQSGIYWQGRYIGAVAGKRSPMVVSHGCEDFYDDLLKELCDLIHGSLREWWGTYIGVGGGQPMKSVDTEVELTGKILSKMAQFYESLCTDKKRKLPNSKVLELYGILSQLYADFDLWVFNRLLAAMSVGAIGWDPYKKDSNYVPAVLTADLLSIITGRKYKSLEEAEDGDSSATITYNGRKVPYTRVTGDDTFCRVYYPEEYEEKAKLLRDWFLHKKDVYIVEMKDTALQDSDDPYIVVPAGSDPRETYALPQDAHGTVVSDIAEPAEPPMTAGRCEITYEQVSEFSVRQFLANQSEAFQSIGVTSLSEFR